MNHLRYVYGLMVLLVLIGSGAAPGAGAQRSDGDGLRPPVSVDLMSFNIRNGKAKDGPDHWDLRRGRVYSVLREKQPDVVGLQEAYRFQIDAIRGALPRYGEVGEGRDGGAEGEYSAILYRVDRFEVVSSGTFWLSDTPGVPSRNWGAGLNRVCTWARFIERATGRSFFVFNTHFDHRSQPS
ncbi:MAG: endonuclease/exonuclease/phosphatase family protein, partial [Planctomycetota bacterium]